MEYKMTKWRLNTRTR